MLFLEVKDGMEASYMCTFGILSIEALIVAGKNCIYGSTHMHQGLHISSWPPFKYLLTIVMIVLVVFSAPVIL